jgi:hypothetical protein
VQNRRENPSLHLSQAELKRYNEIMATQETANQFADQINSIIHLRTIYSSNEAHNRQRYADRHGGSVVFGFDAESQLRNFRERLKINRRLMIITKSDRYSNK